MPFTGVEIGWRLARPTWGYGYATEAARAALEFGFDAMGLPEIIAVTMAANLRSQAVMRRIGMTSDPAENFDDPDADEGPLRLARGIPETAGPPSAVAVGARNSTAPVDGGCGTRTQCGTRDPREKTAAHPEEPSWINPPTVRPAQCVGSR